MSKVFRLFLYLLLLSVISCSYLPQATKSHHNNKTQGMRIPANSVRAEGCKNILDNFLKILEEKKSLETIREDDSYSLAFVSNNRLKIEGLIDKIQTVLDLSYEGIQVKKIADQKDGYYDYKRYLVTSSKTESFEIVEKRKYRRGRVRRNFLFKEGDKVVDREFYLNILSILNKKNIIKIKANKYRGNFVEKVKTDLMLLSLSKNFKNLKDGIETKTKAEFVNHLDSILDNLKGFKNEIYHLENNNIIQSYFDLVYELERLKITEISKMNNEADYGLTRLEKLIQNFKKTAVFKVIFKRSDVLKENEEFYNEVLKKFQDRSLKTFKSKTDLENTFEEYIFLKKMGDDSSVYSHLTGPIDYPKFYMWYKTHVDIHLNTFALDRDITMREYYFELVESFRKFENQTSQVDGIKMSLKGIINYVKKNMTQRSEAKKLETNFHRLSAKSYNSVKDTNISSIDSLTKFKQKIAVTILNYKSFEDHFNDIGFFRWLNKNNNPSFTEFNKMKKENSEGVNHTVGSYLREKYIEYAPYSKINERQMNMSFKDRNKEKVVIYFKSMKSKIKACKKKGSCIQELITNKVKGLFKKSTYKNKFSCLRSNPSLFVMYGFDLSFYSLSLLALNHYSDQDNFSWNLFATALTTMIFLDEANCRTGKTAMRNFGDTVNPEKLVASKKLKKQFMLDNIKNLSVTTAYSMSALTLYTMIFNSMMGQEVEGQSNIATMFMFNFIHFGLWGNMKKLMAFLPIRYRGLPKLSAALKRKVQSKFGNGAYLSNYYRRIFDSSFYFGMSYFNNWDYLTLYQGTIVPKVMAMFGFSNSLNVNNEYNVASELSNITTLDKKSELKINKRILDNGIVSKTLIEEIEMKNGTKKSITVGFDIFIPEEIQKDFMDSIINDIEKNIERHQE